MEQEEEGVENNEEQEKEEEEMELICVRRKLIRIVYLSLRTVGRYTHKFSCYFLLLHGQRVMGTLGLHHPGGNRGGIEGGEGREG